MRLIKKSFVNCHVLIISTCLVFILLSCTNKIENSTPSVLIKQASFQSILDTANLKGSILIFGSEEDSYYSNDFNWSKLGKLPASTFKVPHSMIALETSTIENEATIFKWNGEKRALKNWEQDLSFKEAYHESCVPCYQGVARKIGVDKMKKHLKRLDYGKIEVDSSTIDNFWLTGKSMINQFQQIDFLKRFYESKLSITPRTEKIMKSIMIMDENEDYILSGKTGWSTDKGQDNGWFIGFLESENKVYYFATNIEPLEGFDMMTFPMIRKDITYSAFRKLHIIK